MKRTLAILTVITAVFCTACGHDTAETDYAASTEETQAVTEKETEESTEAPTEEQTEPVSELVEGDVIEIDGKKHKVVDFDDEIAAMYNTMGSYLDLKESKIPEKLKNIPENWETVTRYGISLKVPTGFTETEMDGNPMLTVCTEDGTEVEIAFSLVEETEETLQSPEEIEKITEAFASIGVECDGTRESIYRAALSISREDADNAPEEYREKLYMTGAYLMFKDGAFIVERDNADIFIFHVPTKIADDGKHIFMGEITKNGETVSTYAVVSEDMDTALQIAATAETE